MERAERLTSKFGRLYTERSNNLIFVALMDSAEITPANITANINLIPMLNGTNFKSWQENLNIVLAVMDHDLALRVDSPAPLTDKSTSNEKREMKRWERSNRICMMIIKKAIPGTFNGTMSDKVKTAKEFMAEIEKVFVKSEKSKICTLLTSLISMWYQGKGNIREYIMQMSYFASKLKALKLDISEDLLVHLVLISLPPQFSQFKVSYNYQKETWSLNELISHYVPEEDRLKREKIESANLADVPKDKRKDNKRKNKEVANTATQKKQYQEPTTCGCFFCKAAGHKKKDCTNYHAWREKKSTPLNFVWSKVNLTLVPRHRW
ncbi:uncharacterized protein [Nicotiana tomentosiformis]|uniref:uncharacterized protein n=1 Tax=Nicotiana tomentosiformis TaxID=4098 RepID=UPI00388CDDE4